MNERIQFPPEYKLNPLLLRLPGIPLLAKRYGSGWQLSTPI